MNKRFIFSALVLLLLFSISAVVSAGDNNIQWAQLGHNSRDTLYRNPGGAVTTGTPIVMRLRAADGDLTAAQVRVWNDRVDSSTLYNMTRVAGGVTFTGDPNTYEFWEVTLPASALPTVYWYRFIAIDGSATAYYEDDGGRTGGWGETFGSSPDNSWQLTIYDPSFTTPDWVKDAVIYQIFPDRFRNGNASNDPAAGGFFYGANDTIVRSNTANWNTAICDPRSRPGAWAACANAYSQNFYGGDLQGIIDKMSYINSLGVTAIYLNPIFESPSNHKYDTTDFMVIDDNFGDLATFQALVAAADVYGIEIILDGVFNHSSSDSIYFDRYGRYATVGACESNSGSYTPWYPFFPYTGGGSAPCSDNRDYPKWFGIFDSLPVFQHDYGPVRDYFINNGTASVGPYWIAQGADGWRLDVAPEIDHGTINDPSDDYWEDFRAAVHAIDPDTYIVGEEWGNPTSWNLGGEWDATMNYQFSSAVLSYWRDEPFVDNDHNGGSSAGVLNPIGPGALNERLLNLEERYAPEAFQAMMNLFGSHDTSRVLFMLNHDVDTNNTALFANPNYDWSDSISRLKGAVLLQMTMPGAPTIYYGDEVAAISPPSYDGSQWQDDPYNRVPYPWMDQSGTPYYTHMQGTATQIDLFDYYATLTGIRNSTPALRTGSLDPLVTNDALGVYVYGRKMADDSSAAVVMVNKSTTAQSVTVNVLGYIPAGAILTDALNGGTFEVDGTGNIVPFPAGSWTIPARGGRVLIVQDPFTGARPSAVSGLSATPGANQITLNWTDTGNNYLIYRSRLSGGGYELLNSSNTNSYTDTTAVNATRYYYVVVTEDTFNGTLLHSNQSNEVTAVPAYNLASNSWYNMQWPPEIGTGNNAYPQPVYNLSAVLPTTYIYGQIWIQGATDASNTVVPGIMAQVGYGPDSDHPSSPSWTWFPMEPNPGYNFAQNNDEYRGNMLPTEAGTFGYTTRYSADGGNTWYYTDLDGPPYNAANNGTLVVSLSSDTTPPAAPTNLDVQSRSAGSISLVWDTHPNTDGDLYGFEVWRQNTATPGFTKLTTIADAGANSYSDTTVTSGQEYQYYLIAVDASLNKSPQSNTTDPAVAENVIVDVTFNVTVPDPSPGTVYIAGSFGSFPGSPYPSWNPGGIAMTQDAGNPNLWSVTLQILDGTALQYKYTRGTWETVEKEADGNAEIANRTLTVDSTVPANNTANNTVANWRDPLVVSYTPANGATVVNTTAITLTWNQAMPDPISGFTLTGPGGAVAGTFSYNSGTNTTTFTPNAPLAAGSYTASVTGASDAAGDVQQVPTSWSFTAVELGSINITPSSGLVTTEAGGTAQFTVTLSKQPTATVRVALSTSDTTEGTVAPSVALNATNWNTGVVVTVTGVNDNLADGNIAYSIITGAVTSTDPAFSMLTGADIADVSVTNNDDEAAVGIIVSPTSGLVTTEAGGTAQFNIKLATQPTSNVTIALSSSDTTEGTVPTGVTITTATWNTGVNVTVTGKDDVLDDGDISYTIVTGAVTSADPAYSAITAGNIADVSVTNSDNDTSGFLITPTSGLVTTEGGGTATFTIRLTSRPSTNVTIALSSSDTTEGTVRSFLTFTPDTWNLARTVIVTGVNDALADGNIAYSIITGAVTSADSLYSTLAPSSIPDISVTNNDDETSPLAAPAVTSISPVGTLTQTPVEFSWVGNASNYRLNILQELSVEGELQTFALVKNSYEASVVCENGVCAVQPNIPLTPGVTYVWIVEALGTDGQVIGSAALSFTMPSVMVAPAEPELPELPPVGVVPPVTLVSPVRETSENPVAFTWIGAADATGYHLLVQNQADRSAVVDMVVDVASCNGNVCVSIPAFTPAQGVSYVWTVQVITASGAGTVSAEASFSYNPAAPGDGIELPGTIIGQ